MVPVKTKAMKSINNVSMLYNMNNLEKEGWSFPNE
jgi:hypothetical protein